MRKALTLMVAGLVLAGCGTSISAEDKAAADSFIDGKSQFEVDALCEQISTAEGRLDAKKSVEDELGGVSVTDMAAAGGPDSPEQQAALDKIGKSLVEGKEVAKRAESIVSYIKDNRC